MTIDSEVATEFRNVSISTGAGNDAVLIKDQRLANIDVAGPLPIWTDAGNDRVDLVIGSGLNITRDLGISTGAGSDVVGITDSAKFGAIAGADLAATVANLQAVVADSDVPGSQTISVGRDMNVFTGAGDDTIAALGVEVERDSIINADKGTKDFVGISNFAVGRNLGLWDTDVVVMQNANAVGYFGIICKGSNDFIVIEKTRVGKNVDIDPRGGHDQLAFGNNVTVAGAIKLKGGAGR